MRKSDVVRILAVAGLFQSALTLAQAAAPAPAAPAAPAAQAPQHPMGFFVTSKTGGSGNLGGLAGADKMCQDLAAAAGAGNRTWHAYLSTQSTPAMAGENARDRIGTGPWYNSK